MGLKPSSAERLRAMRPVTDTTFYLMCGRTQQPWASYY